MTVHCTGSARLFDCAVSTPLDGQPGQPMQVVGYVQLRYAHGKFHVKGGFVEG